MLPIINIIFVLLFIVGVIFLQIFLSKKENKWLGLFLPLIAFVYSIIAILGYIGYMEITTTDQVISVIMIFIQCNISTLILLGIYAGCRRKFKKDKEINKMKIQDLE